MKKSKMSQSIIFFTATLMVILGSYFYISPPLSSSVQWVKSCTICDSIGQQTEVITLDYTLSYIFFTIGIILYVILFMYLYYVRRKFNSTLS